MESRQEQLLKLVIENYIKTAEPIGSKFLAELGELGVSGATIRNELSELEKAGYLTHPHTSAGRIPTEQGYKYYVETILKEREEAKSPSEINEKINAARDLKELGKQSAAESQTAIIVTIGDNVYYTGTSYLYAQPEFEDMNHTVQVSEIFDHFEDHIPHLFELVADGQERVFIGSENPFGAEVSAIVVKLNDDVLFTLLGPMRMDYKRNIELIECIQNIIEHNKKFLM